jgi:hypothetical protein
VKFNLNPPDSEVEEYVILHTPLSVDLEYELKQRFQAFVTAVDVSKSMPPFTYVGIFAGATKPKPFQRKRPNLSKISAGKLPVLSSMRAIAVNRHQGSYAPCPIGASRRITLAFEHIFEGYNSFPILEISSDYGSYKEAWNTNSVLAITEHKLLFYPDGPTGSVDDIPFDWLSFWRIDQEELLPEQRTSGVIRFYFNSTASSGSGEWVVGFPFIRDIKHTLEFFWNRDQLARGLGVMMGSTHGRPLETIHTLDGAIPSPPPPVGHLDIVDADGLVVRPGTMVKPGFRGTLTRASSSRRDSFRFVHLHLTHLSSPTFSHLSPVAPAP